MAYKVIVDDDNVTQAISRAGGLIRPAEAGETLRRYEGARPDNLIRFETRITAEGVITAIDRPSVPPLRQAVRTALDQLDGWDRGLRGVAHLFPAQDVAVGLDFLAYGRRGLRGVVLSTAWTAEQKIAFCQGVVQGAGAGVNSPAAFFAHIEAERLAGRVIASPPGRVMWRDPRTGAAWTLGEAALRSAAFQAQLASEATNNADLSWVDEIID